MTSRSSDLLPPVDRRAFLRLLGAAGASSALFPRLSTFAAEPGWTASEADRELIQFPGKGELVLRADRPPELETPLRWFQEDITPNDVFYVRWHLAGIPQSVDTNKYRLQIGGHVERPLQLSLDDIRHDFEPVEIVAVNQCSGNSRSLYRPVVPGVQWSNGAMGNAKWKGARLKDILAKAGVRAGAVDVSLNGLDTPVLNATPDFVKSLGTDHANDPNILVAYEMNGQPLPMLNGFPVRLIVPGWYATYWVKALSDITVLPEKFKGFWMEKAYRIPAAPRAAESPQALDPQTVPISHMDVRSFITSHAYEADVDLDKPTEISGIAFDGGSGIKRVEVSTDKGATWADAALGPDLGNFSFRRFRLPWQPKTSGAIRLLCRATSNAGETQDNAKIWNRGGYMRNVIEHVDVFVS